MPIHTNLGPELQRPIYMTIAINPLSPVWRRSILGRIESSHIKKAIT